MDAETIVVGIISMLLGLNGKIIYDWLRSAGNKEVNGYVKKDVCELKHKDLSALLEVHFKAIDEKLDEIKRKVE